MSDNNLEDLNEITTSASLSETELQEKSTQGQEFLLRLVDKNRKKGIEQLKTKLESLSNVDRLDSKLENTLRELRAGLNGGLISLEALNSFSEFLRHDLVALAQNLNIHAKQQWQTGAHLQTLLKTLVDKGIVTTEELETTWNSIVKNSEEEVKEQLIT